MGIIGGEIMAHKSKGGRPPQPDMKAAKKRITGGPTGSKEGVGAPIKKKK